MPYIGLVIKLIKRLLIAIWAFYALAGLLGFIVFLIDTDGPARDPANVAVLAAYLIITPTFFVWLILRYAKKRFFEPTSPLS